MGIKNENSGSLHMRSRFYFQPCCWQTVWIWALHLYTLHFPLHKIVDAFANLSLSRTQHTLVCYYKCLLLSLVSHWWPVCGLHSWVQSGCRGLTVPCTSVCARQCLLGSVCWVMPACTPWGSLCTAVCSCHIISGGDCIFCHIPLHAQRYIFTLWMWITVSGMNI